MISCPVRAVKRYLQETRQFWPACGYHWLGLENRRNFIEFWLRKVISLGYVSASDEDCMAVKVSIHEVYSVSLCMAFKENFAINQVFQLHV